MNDTTETKPLNKRSRRMVREPKPVEELDPSTSAPPPEGDAKSLKPASKTYMVLTMLQRPEGATIAQLAAATGWLPHTTRAALTGLKKKGREITSAKVDGEERVYRVVAS